jgi:hypothetical protein
MRLRVRVRMVELRGEKGSGDFFFFFADGAALVGIEP